MILWVSEQKQYFKFWYPKLRGGDEAKKKERNPGEPNYLYVLSLVHK